MTAKHIRRTVVLGVIVETAAVIAAGYGFLSAICWIADRLPDWSVHPMFGLLITISLWLVFHDWLPRKRTIRGYRLTVEQL